MKTLKYIFLVIVLLVSNVVNAQFTYEKKECKDSQIRPVNKAEWVKVEGTKYRPAVAGSNPLIYEVTELCSHFYGKAAVGGTYALTQSKAAPMGELAIGREVCFGLKSAAKQQIKFIESQAAAEIAKATTDEARDVIKEETLSKIDAIQDDHKNYKNTGLSFELKAGITKMHGLEREDLSKVLEAYAYYVGGNIYLHLNKHAKNIFSIYGGAAYTRLKSEYPETEEYHVREVGYNTISFEGGVQYMHKLSYGNKIGGRVFFNTIQNQHVSQEMIGVAVVYEINKVHKSKAMPFSDWKATNKKINEARKAALMK